MVHRVSSGVHCPLGVICISKKDRPFVKNVVVLQYLVFIYYAHSSFVCVYVFLHTFTIFLTEVVRLQIQSLILWHTHTTPTMYSSRIYISNQWIAKTLPSVSWMCEYLFRLVLLLWVFRVESGIISIYTNDITYIIRLHNIFIPVNRCCYSVDHVLWQFIFQY